MEEHGTARQATNYNTIRRMRIACWVSKATNTQLECVTLLIFNGNNGDVDAPHCYVTLTVPSLVIYCVCIQHSLFFRISSFSYIHYFILFFPYLSFIVLSYNVIFTLAFSTLIPSLSQPPFLGYFKRYSYTFNF
jgi:hypothetical protein